MQQIKHTHTLSVPMSYCAGLIHFAVKKGADYSWLLNVAGVQSEQLEDAAAEVDASRFVDLFNAVIDVCGGDSIAYELGLASKLNSHGFLGYALMSCATLAEVIDVLLRYYPTRLKIASIHQFIDEYNQPPMMIFALLENLDLGNARQTFFNTIIFELTEAVHFLVGNRSVELEIWLDYPEPPHFALWKDKLPKIVFSKPQVQIRIPLSQLETPIAMANPIAKKIALEQCETALQKMSQISSQPTTEIVLVLFEGNKSHVYPSIEIIASQLNMSERTLKRRLQTEGTTFQVLLNEVRTRKALELLKNTNDSIELIASQLGYTDPANFTRAFKKWTGKSPITMRKELLTRL